MSNSKLDAIVDGVLIEESGDGERTLAGFPWVFIVGVAIKALWPLIEKVIARKAQGATIGEATRAVCAAEEFKAIDIDKLILLIERLWPIIEKIIDRFTK